MIGDKHEQTVTLVSSDGKPFVVPRAVSMQSAFLKEALERSIRQDKLTLHLDTIHSSLMPKLLSYMHYKHRYVSDGKIDGSSSFYLAPDDPLSMELLRAADFLGL